MDVVLKTFSNAFYSTKKFKFQLKFHWGLSLNGQLTMNQTGYDNCLAPIKSVCWCLDTGCCWPIIGTALTKCLACFLRSFCNYQSIRIGFVEDDVMQLTNEISRYLIEFEWLCLKYSPVDLGFLELHGLRECQSLPENDVHGLELRFS